MQVTCTVYTFLWVYTAYFPSYTGMYMYTHVPLQAEQSFEWHRDRVPGMKWAHVKEAFFTYTQSTKCSDDVFWPLTDRRMNTQMDRPTD